MQSLLKQIDRLSSQRPYCKPALEAYRVLARLMAEVKPQSPGRACEKRWEEVKRKEGFPLFSTDEIPLDFEASSELLRRFFEHLSGQKREDQDGLNKALNKMKADSGWAGQLLRAGLKKEEKTLSRMAKEVGLDPGTLHYLARTALKPALQALRDSFSDDIGRESWDQGYCPFCGAQPDMAYFAESGKRFLHCELCGQEWPYPRIKCPFCRNQDHEMLGYFYDEKEEGFRVDFCRKCGRYLKTIDKRVFEEPAPMELESLATLHLDLLAKEQGFK